MTFAISTGRAPFQKGQKGKPKKQRHPLRENARGQRCALRLDCCNHDPETTVLAHLRHFGWAGTAQKPNDMLAVFACKGARSLRSFESDAARVSARIAGTMAKVGVAVAAAAAAYTGLAAKAAQVGTEIANLSRLAGVNTTDFQRMAAAVDTVGISQEKLADILKDVNDRVGDFMATGGGPMKDFFENIAPLVGVTADQFARLSGPEALQLYVTSLQRAGASQQDMTFYLEAMASDATALIPLLRDNGREMQRLGDEAQRTGRILDQETVQGTIELDRKMTALKETIRNELITALISTEDELAVLAQFVTDYAIPALQSMIEFAASAAQTFMSLADAIRGTASASAALNLDPTGGNAGTTGGPMSAEDAKKLYGDSLELPPLGVDVAPPGSLRPTFGENGKSGGGGGKDSTSDFERLQDKFATEAELIQTEYERQVQMLAEFREKKVATDEEFNELERRIHADHQQSILDLERKTQAARLQSIAGAFGDLSSLMSSENKKMFQIGKAAAIAEATVSGYQAAVDAWAKGMKVGGPPAAAAFTAASLAKTGALISSIASQNAAGGGGSASAGASFASGVDQSGPSRVVNVQLTGGEAYGKGQVRELLSMINEELENGGRINLV